MNASVDIAHGSDQVAGIDLGGTNLGSLVERRRLIDRLASAGTPVILVQAPAGYGKSVLLAQWAQVDRRPFASVALSESHDDPAVLVASLIEALDPIEPVPADLVSALRVPKPNLDLLAARLEAALRGRQVAAVLVLDELENLKSPASLRIVEALVDGIGGESQLAISTRSSLPHASRLQAARRLTVLGVADLTMTAREGRELLGRVGLNAPERELEDMLRKSEGWPAALYLAALSRRSNPRGVETLSVFAGDERALVDYMREELLAGAPQKDADFLVRSSFLDRLNGELCDAVLRTQGSAATLSRLARDNMLLIPLDNRDEWFRLHTLFAEMLRSALRRDHAAEAAELNRRASEWWTGQGEPQRAVGFALQAGDVDRAGKLIWDTVPVYNATGRWATIEGWLEQIGLDRAASNPHLAVTIAHGCLAAGEGEAAEHWAGIARQLGHDLKSLEPSVEAGLAMVDGPLARSGVAGIRASTEEALGVLPTDDRWRSMTSLMAGVAARLCGEVEQGRERLSDSARRAAIWNVPLIQVLALAELALLEAGEGDWQTAGILASQSRAQIDRSGLVEMPTMALPIAVAAYVNAAERRTKDARSNLKLGRGLLQRIKGFGAWYEVEAAAALASAAIELNDAAAASEHLKIARARLGAVPDAPALESWVASIEAGVTRVTESGVGDLTPAELRLLRLLPTHLSFPQIAARLYVSPNTVKTQARAAYRKLGVSSRQEAVGRCRELNLVAAGPEETGADPLPSASS